MKHGKTLAFLAVLGARPALGFSMHSVLADGIPTPNPLYYSGTLTEGLAALNVLPNGFRSPSTVYCRQRGATSPKAEALRLADSSHTLSGALTGANIT